MSITDDEARAMVGGRSTRIVPTPRWRPSRPTQTSVVPSTSTRWTS